MVWQARKVVVMSVFSAWMIVAAFSIPFFLAEVGLVIVAAYALYYRKILRSLTATKTMLLAAEEGQAE
jgi:hypothetical protein